MPERILTHRPPHGSRRAAAVERCRLDTEVHGLDDRSIEIYGCLSFYKLSPKAARTDTGLRTASTRKCCRKMLLRVRLQHVQDMVQDVLLVRYFF